jgi:hypothetical protein
MLGEFFMLGGGEFFPLPQLKGNIPGAKENKKNCYTSHNISRKAPGF